MTVEAPIVQNTQRPERIDIGDGLVMRWSTIKDANNIADCMAHAFKVFCLFSFFFFYARYDTTLCEIYKPCYEKQAPFYLYTERLIVALCAGSIANTSGLAFLPLSPRMRSLPPTLGSRLAS